MLMMMAYNSSTRRSVPHPPAAGRFARARPARAHRPRGGLGWWGAGLRFAAGGCAWNR